MPDKLFLVSAWLNKATYATQVSESLVLSGPDLFGGILKELRCDDAHSTAESVCRLKTYGFQTFEQDLLPEERKDLQPNGEHEQVHGTVSLVLHVGYQGSARR